MTVSDRELLELAARAAGVCGEFRDGLGLCPPELSQRHKYYWNPLTDDGDALRLAFALGMSVDAGGCIIDFVVPDVDDDEMETQESIEFDNHDGDIGNLRRAIVRAAAHIGGAKL